MKTTKGIWLVAALALIGTARIEAAAQDTDGNDFHAARAGVTVGGRAAYYRPKEADSGTLNGGLQIRFHITPVIAVEGSGDYRRNRYGGTRVDIFPLQASLLLYLAPRWAVSPFLLGGVGWYYTHVQGSGGATNHRYGPHAGAGLEAALGRRWSIDGSYRYLWTQSLRAPTTAHPAGRNFSDNGFMLTTALNYRF